MKIESTKVKKDAASAIEPVLKVPHIRAAISTDLLPGGSSVPSPIVNFGSGLGSFYLYGFGPASSLISKKAGQLLSIDETHQLIDEICEKSDELDQSEVEAALTKDTENRIKEAKHEDLEKFAKNIGKVNKGAEAAISIAGSPGLVGSATPVFAAATAIIGGVGVIDAFANDRSNTQKGLSIGLMIAGGLNLAAIFEPRLAGVAETAGKIMLIGSGVAAAASLLSD